MTDYNDIAVLLHALDNHDVRTVRKCIDAGQSLNQEVVSKYGEEVPLLLNAIEYEHKSRFLALMVFRKYVDLNVQDMDGFSALYYAWEKGIESDPDLIYMDMLLRFGATIDQQLADEALLFSKRPSEQFCAKVLLFCGAKTKNISSKLNISIEKWLSGLDVAKSMLEEIFDDPNLEIEIILFAYDEKALHQQIS